eukprot:1151474-Prorocentrum_lima.AAC.1
MVFRLPPYCGVVFQWGVVYPEADQANVVPEQRGLGDELAHAPVCVQEIGEDFLPVGHMLRPARGQGIL